MPKTHREQGMPEGEPNDRPVTPSARATAAPAAAADRARTPERDDPPRRNPYAELRRRDARTIEMAYAHGATPRQGAYRAWDDAVRTLVRRLGARHPDLGDAVRTRRLADAYRRAGCLQGGYGAATETRALLKELQANLGAMLLYMHAGAADIGQALALDDELHDDRELPWKAA